MNKIWLFADYKQAESRVVAWRGPVPRLKQWFKDGVDIHTEIAKSIAKIVQENKLILPNKLFQKKPWHELTNKDKDERQIGKTTGHAGNYGIQKNTLGLFLNMPPKYAELILAIYHTQFPEIKRGYQFWIEECIRNNRTIITAMGRPKIFYDIIGDELMRAAYAYYGQSTIGDLLTNLINKISEHFQEIKFNDANIWTPTKIRQCGFDTRLNAHDAVGISIPDSTDLIAYTVKVIKKESAYAMNIGGDELIIPMDFKIGRNWGELKDYES